MSVTLHWSGLDEFKVNLSKLPDTLGAASEVIVDRAATNAAADIRQGYPATAESLSSHVFISTIDKGKTTKARIVKNTSPLAFIFENGTQARHYFSKGRRAIHLTGRMPPSHVFVPRIIKYRKIMYGELKSMLVAQGLVVTGET